MKMRVLSSIAGGAAILALGAQGWPRSALKPARSF